MNIGIRAMSVFVAGASALALAACGPSETPSAAGDVVVQEGEELGDGARTGPAADSVRAVDEWSDAAQAKIQKDGLGNTIEEAADNAGDRIEQSGKVFEDAYKKARAEGQGPLDAASDGYNAVDRHHVPVDEKPQAE